MSENKNQIVQKEEKPINQTLSSIVPGQPLTFPQMLNMAKIYSQSKLVPTNFSGNVPDCLIAVEISERVKASPLMVMQNLYIVNGKPSWSSQYIIAMLNSCGRFTPIKFKLTGDKKNRECIAYAQDKDTKEVLESPVISMEMAKDEGWIDKKGSKWKTMPDVMLRYRAASFFGRLYAPDLLMGIYSKEEVIEGDFIDVQEANDKDELQEQVNENANKEKLEVENEQPTEEPVQDSPGF